MADRALVVGSTGLVGRAVSAALESNGWDVVGTSRSASMAGLQPLDIRDRQAVARLLAEVKPKITLLPAAMTDVDGCERDPATAQAVNVDGARHVAESAAAMRSSLVYYSTDFIFDGIAGPYSEDSDPNPVSVYGTTKLAAEQLIQAVGSDHLIIRTTVVYGWDRGSKNFAMQVWRQLSNGEQILVPSDQLGTPTLADYLGEVTVRLLEVGRRGIINVAGKDRLSRANFARRLARSFGLDAQLVVDVPTAASVQFARRPLEAGLLTEGLASALHTEPMNLDEALRRVRRHWRADTHVPTGGGAAASSRATVLKDEILDKVREYYLVAHAEPEFRPFASRVPYSGRVYGPEELVNVVSAGLDFWLTLGPWGEQFERSLRRRLGARDVVLVNSGSSANLTAVTALMAPQLENRMRPGDEVITPAVTFPTTLTPLLQNGLVPVLVDCDLGTYNARPELIADAIGARTRAILVPHTLGNPCDLVTLTELAQEHGLFLIEDSCDALGGTFDGKPVGTFGDLATLSFYPAHHITMGEGGAVIVNRPRLARVVRAVRDWGRDCWCAPGESNTCGKRFGWQLGDLPEGYDHKYVYSNIGYNLKPTDMQAAIGVAQLERLDHFVESRRRNFAALFEGLQPFQDRVILPRWDPRAEPSWFGFPITVGPEIQRRVLVQWLEEANIETRQLFGGNILKQPAFLDAPVRVHGELANTDRVVQDTFFVGVYPGLQTEMIDFVLERFCAFFAR